MRIFPAFLFLTFIAGSVEGQRQESLQSRRWEYVALPAINFSTDEGFGYGVLLEAYNHGAGAKPYRFTIQPTVFMTTKGRRDVTLFFDAPGLLAGGWRLDGFLGREQELAAPYYGVGNDTEHDTTRSAAPNDYFYRYGRTRIRTLATLQRRIGQSPARWLAGVGYADVRTDATPFDSGTTLFQQQLAGAPAPRGQLAFVRAGLVFDSRDREIGPRSGWWNELLVQRVEPRLGASHDYTRLTAAARRYSPLGARVTLASRVVAQQVVGTPPMWDIASVQTSFRQEEGLGGSKMLRGIPKNRVVGKGLLLANNELRWRASDFRLLGRSAHLVLSSFVDAGRVWTREIRPAEAMKDLWVGYGGGARLGLGSSSIIAFDLGRSSEGTQLYIGLGYAY
jgi:hypothetical protein